MAQPASGTSAPAHIVAENCFSQTRDECGMCMVCKELNACGIQPLHMRTQAHWRQPMVLQPVPRRDEGICWNM
jgi:hypothetical protein